MKTKTLQEQYNLIKEGKGNKEIFLKEAKLQFPHLIRNAANFIETTTILKQRSIISENILQLGLVTQNKKQNWFDIFNQNIVEQNETNVKVDSNKVAKEVEDDLDNNFDYKNKKNIDNVYGGAFLNGFYTEMQNPKNADKTIDELKAIVTKNLAKDRLYYTTQTQFGIEGIGYTDQTPGYKPSKELKGKYKSSGYGDLDIDTEKIKANTKDTLGKKEAKTKMPSGVKEMPVTPKTVSGVKKMDMPGAEKTIKLKEGIHDRDITSASHTNVKQSPGGFWDDITYENASKLFDYHERTGNLPAGLSPEGFDKIMKKFNISRMDDSDIPFKNMTENKMQSLKKKVAEIVKEILSEDDILDEDKAADDKARAAKETADKKKAEAADAAILAAKASEAAAIAQKKESEPKP